MSRFGLFVRCHLLLLSLQRAVAIFCDLDAPSVKVYKAASTPHLFARAQRRVKTKEAEVPLKTSSSIGSVAAGACVAVVDLFT